MKLETIPKILLPKEQLKGKILSLAKEAIFYDQYTRKTPTFNLDMSSNYTSASLGVGISSLTEENIAEYRNYLNTQQAIVVKIFQSISLTMEEKLFKEQYILKGIIEKFETKSIHLIHEIIKLNSGKFPTIKDFGQEVVLACFIIFQHMDKSQRLSAEQYRGFKLMVESKIKNRNNISLVYLYYIVDRLTRGAYGYQFFGTQDNGDNTINLPFSTQTLNQNPEKFMQLVDSKITQTVESNNDYML